MNTPLNEPPQAGVSTWELFRELGFQADSEVMSDDAPGLSIRWGDFELTASWVMNRCFANIVLLSGVLAYRRSIALIENEMPRSVDSREQGIAWLVWILDKASPGKFQPPNAQEWLAEGRRYVHLLPWERENAEYAARPRCSVQRDWLKVAIKKLAEHLSVVDTQASVDFSFDGRMLTIRCSDEVCAMPADGQAWNHIYSVQAGQLTSLPKRLMRRDIEISVQDSCLIIGNRSYRGVVATGTGNSPCGNTEHREAVQK